MSMKQSTERSLEKAAKQIAEQCLGLRARCVGRQLTAIYDTALSKLNITGNQLTLIVAITRLRTVSPKELSQKLGLEKSTLSRNINRLEAFGYIDVAPGESARSQQLSVTPKGKKLLLKALPLWQEAQAQVQKTLGSEGTEGIHLSYTALQDAD